MRVIVNEPEVLYVYDGLWLVDVPPSPKVQFHPVGVPSEGLIEVAVNWTIRGAIPFTGVAV